VVWDRWLKVAQEASRGVMDLIGVNPSAYVYSYREVVMGCSLLAC